MLIFCGGHLLFHFPTFLFRVKQRRLNIPKFSFAIFDGPVQFLRFFLKSLAFFFFLIELGFYFLQVAAFKLYFFGFYLLSHGVVKLLLVAALLRGKHWAYPAALVTLTLLVAYQLYRYSYTHSPGLIALSAFDVIVLALIFAEYRGVRRGAV